MLDFLLLISSGESLTDAAVALCLHTRPLPEEEELEDELFAGTSEAEAGNETEQKKKKNHLAIIIKQNQMNCMFKVSG